jgi:hypothetical protein
LRGLAEAMRLTLETFRVLLEAVRVFLEAVRKIIKAVRLLKVWWQDATLFVYFSYFITYKHPFNHIHTIHLSTIIR